MAPSDGYCMNENKKLAVIFEFLENREGGNSNGKYIASSRKKPERANFLYGEMGKNN